MILQCVAKLKVQLKKINTVKYVPQKLRGTTLWVLCYGWVCLLMLITHHVLSHPFSGWLAKVSLSFLWLIRRGSHNAGPSAFNNPILEESSCPGGPQGPQHWYQWPPYSTLKSAPLIGDIYDTVDLIITLSILSEVLIIDNLHNIENHPQFRVSDHF